MADTADRLDSIDRRLGAIEQRLESIERELGVRDALRRSEDNRRELADQSLRLIEALGDARAELRRLWAERRESSTGG